MMAIARYVALSCQGVWALPCIRIAVRSVTAKKRKRIARNLTFILTLNEVIVATLDRNPLCQF